MVHRVPENGLVTKKTSEIKHTRVLPWPTKSTCDANFLSRSRSCELKIVSHFYHRNENILNLIFISFTYHIFYEINYIFIDNLGNVNIIRVRQEHKNIL